VPSTFTRAYRAGARNDAVRACERRAHRVAVGHARVRDADATAELRFEIALVALFPRARIRRVAEVVDHDHVVAALRDRAAQVKADEANPARHHPEHLRQTFGLTPTPW
jgi:hypothetical protein